MHRQHPKKHFKTISQLLRALGCPPPSHPLITLVDYKLMPPIPIEKEQGILLDFYKVSFKDRFTGKTKYGQGYYDFEEGGLAFLKPRQLVFAPEDPESYQGFALYFHPDFIRNYPLGKSIQRYGFFSYDVSEALFLSAQEKEIIHHLFATIVNELKNNIDKFSQDILVSQLELLLNYSNRFYERQFITRKVVNSEIVSSLDQLLARYFGEKKGLEKGLPSVKFISGELKVSQRYLSDMLRSITGLNTQQYIQEAVIENAKDKLSSTELSVSEIAFELGFEHPQSFSKLFKQKTNQSPLEYRQSFN